MIALTDFLCLHYIYDFFLWQRSEEKLERFNECVNSIHPSIKLTLMSSATNMSYIDVSVSFDGANILTSIYTKYTDIHGYLY